MGGCSPNPASLVHRGDRQVNTEQENELKTILATYERRTVSEWELEQAVERLYDLIGTLEREHYLQGYRTAQNAVLEEWREDRR